MNKNCNHEFERVAFNSDLENGLELWDCVCKKCRKHTLLVDTDLSVEEREYIKRLLNAQLKDIEQAWEDNKIFYLDDQIEANESQEMIKSILEKL